MYSFTGSIALPFVFSLFGHNLVEIEDLAWKKVGKRGKLYLHPSRQIVLGQGKELPAGEALRYPEAGMFTLLRQFRAAIESGTTPETSGADNLWTLAMYEAALRSAESGRYASISDTFTPQLMARASDTETQSPT